MTKKSENVVDQIPASIVAAFNEYFGTDIGPYGIPLDKALAVRKSNLGGGSYVAILFEKDGEFFAVDFNDGELSNDYVGPFESVKEFKTEKLRRSLFG